MSPLLIALLVALGAAAVLALAVFVGRCIALQPAPRPRTPLTTTVPAQRNGSHR